LTRLDEGIDQAFLGHTLLFGRIQLGRLPSQSRASQPVKLVGECGFDGLTSIDDFLRASRVLE